MKDFIGCDIIVWSGELLSFFKILFLVKFNMLILDLLNLHLKKIYQIHTYIHIHTHIYEFN